MTTATQTLSVIDLHKSYPTPAEPLVVLDGVNLDLAPGRSAAILGPSGSGKSTLLNILGTLDCPTSGKMTLANVDPFCLSPDDLAAFRANRIGFIFQDHHLLPQCTALENVLIAKLAAGPVSQDDVARAELLLKRVGLTNRRTHLPSELSGGERQRVAIARALINRPVLLLCDEPTGNLDARNSDAIGELLSSLAVEDDAIIIVVTHSQALAARFGQRLFLQSGRLTSEN